MEPMIVAEEAAHYGIRAPAALPPSDRYLSPNEAGRILNVTGEAVKQWIYHRRLPATKLSNGYWKIKVADLENFIRARQNLGQKRIMVIDNDEANIKELVGAIERLGHDPIVAHNASDALLKASDLYPSLFIVNVTASIFEPWKLLDKVRKTRNIKNVPMLIVSSQDLQDADSDRALELGAQGFLRTPFKAGVVAEEIGKVLTRIM
ncbi:MAG: helix-turn-helix domain-containing protein [Planctomycetota bacterium]|nr:helix-turn-helix domain-containing protein [Planctomycetota bacterium]